MNIESDTIRQISLTKICTVSADKHDIFGMLVHSCFVEDGGGNRVQILDSKGYNY